MAPWWRHWMVSHFTMDIWFCLAAEFCGLAVWTYPSLSSSFLRRLKSLWITSHTCLASSSVRRVRSSLRSMMPGNHLVNWSKTGWDVARTHWQQEKNTKELKDWELSWTVMQRSEIMQTKNWLVEVYSRFSRICSSWFFRKSWNNSHTRFLQSNL